MVNTEMLPRCSRVISASSDTTHLHRWTPRCARFIHLRSAYIMTCNLQVMIGQLNDHHHFTWLCCADSKRSGSPSYFLKCVKRQRISSSAPGPSCGCKSWVLTRCPVSLSTMASFTGCPVFRSTNLSGGPASPETAHLSPTCNSACRTRMVSRPFGVRTYSYRSGLVWYRRRSTNSLSSRCFSRSDKVALVTPVDRRRSSYRLNPSDRSRRIKTAQRSPIASRTPAIEHAIPSKLFDFIKYLAPSHSYH